MVNEEDILLYNPSAGFRPSTDSGREQGGNSGSDQADTSGEQGGTFGNDSGSDSGNYGGNTPSYNPGSTPSNNPATDSNNDNSNEKTDPPASPSKGEDKKTGGNGLIAVPVEGENQKQEEEGTQGEDQVQDSEGTEGEAQELPERDLIQKDEPGQEEIQQPWGINIDAGSGWMWGGAALAAVLAGCVVADHFRKRMRKKKRRAARAAVAAAAGASGGSVNVAACQDIGAREDQQDSYEYSHPDLYAQQGLMAVVADGMGGLANGKAVSSALVRTFIDGFPQVSGYYSQTADILLDLSIRANARVNQMLRGADRSGSTLVAALVRDGYLHFLTVGDSRIYLYRGGALLQLNREHIYQEELAVKAVNQGASMAQVRSDRQAHSLTSYFGIGRIPSIDRNDEGIRLVPGDRILLASDGVFGTLTREQMEQAMQLEVQAAAERMGQMIRSEDKPYQDNNTLIIVEYKG